jgi:hypothetical protein
MRTSPLLDPLTSLLFASRTDWPDRVDQLGLLLFILAVTLLPIGGYWLTVLDVRSYLRALRGMLVRVVTPAREVPGWLRDETPACLRALGLSLPCTEDDVKEAYRRLAKELHPDRGGDVRRFLLLQQHLEQAHHYLRQRRDRDESSGAKR